jgi:hypothetical protein
MNHTPGDLYRLKVLPPQTHFDGWQPRGELVLVLGGEGPAGARRADKVLMLYLFDEPGEVYPLNLQWFEALYERVA